MANRVPANLVKAQAKAIQAFQSSELRFRYPATYLAIKKYSNLFLPNYEQLRTREDRTVEVNYLTKGSRTLGTGGRTHNHTGNKLDSAVITPTWSSYDYKFNMSLKQADNSVYDMQEQMNHETQETLATFMEGYETAAVNYLFNNRTGVNVATSEGTFNATEDVFEILAADENRAIQITDIAMDANKYPQGATIFCDSIAFAKFQFQANQGSANSTNLAFQHQGHDFVHSIALGALAAGMVGAYTKGFWIVVPNGTVGVLPWIPVQNRVGVSTSVNEYSSFLNPIDGEVYAVHKYETRADDSANNGYTQDVVSQYQFSQDLAFMKAPLSTATETPIFAFAIK